MRTEALIFNGLTVFFLPVTIVYGFWTDLQEPVGFYAFLLTTLMSLMIGAYLTLIRRNIDPRPEDNPDGMISELAGEQGHTDSPSGGGSRSSVSASAWCPWWAGFSNTTWGSTRTKCAATRRTSTARQVPG